MNYNLRHLRVFLAVAEHGSITRAAETCHITQPAVTQAINKLEAQCAMTLFQRTPQGLFFSTAGEVLAKRVRRAFNILDEAIAEVSGRLHITTTATQLHALIAMREAENFTLAAKRLGIAQPTVHRTISHLEQDAGQVLFTRTAHGMVATKAAQDLAQAARLAFVELDQAEPDLEELNGREVGKIIIGAMPLSRSRLLPKAIAVFRKLRPTVTLQILDGPYNELLAGLRRGEIDLLLGALRTPLPVSDIEQRYLFTDSLALICRRDHPITKLNKVSEKSLSLYPWIVAPAGTPTRTLFNHMFAKLGPDFPASVIESASSILMRELLLLSDHIGCISTQQAEIEARNHPIVLLEKQLKNTERPIGLTVRSNWIPTRAQEDLIHALQQVSIDN
jgi:LysR family transcriptional regulator, regulator for genes of the gallate degradation pathway